MEESMTFPSSNVVTCKTRKSDQREKEDGQFINVLNEFSCQMLSSLHQFLLLDPEGVSACALISRLTCITQLTSFQSCLAIKLLC